MTALAKSSQKCHSIVVTGKVQDIGFRSVVEHIGRSFGMPGMVFNAKDGSVKIICCCDDSVIDDFKHDIKKRGMGSGAEIEDIIEELLPGNIDLPANFSKIHSDDEIDIGRKLDTGNFLLKKGFESLNARFENLNMDLKEGFNKLTLMMSEHNARMEQHNVRLEAMVVGISEHNACLEEILKKLVDKL